MTINKEDLLPLPDFVSQLPEAMARLMASDMTDERKKLCAMLFVESVNAMDLMAQGTRTIAGLGSAREKSRTRLYKHSVSLGKQFGELGYDGVQGDGPGFMEGFARGLRMVPGRKVFGLGITSRSKFEKEPNPYPTHRSMHHNMHTRNFAFFQADAGICFNPGAGTIYEKVGWLVEMQMGLSRPKPLVLFGTAGWREWEKLLSELVKEGRMSPSDLELFSITDKEQEAIDLVLKHAPLPEVVAKSA